MWAPGRLKSGLQEIAARHTGEFRLTGNQNLVVANVAMPPRSGSNVWRENMALCLMTITRWDWLPWPVSAFRPAALAMAESERYLPELLDKIHARLQQHGLGDESIVTRMTGCPNGCARPYLAEIALVGKAPGRYNLFLGGATAGDRINSLYRENIDEQEILTSLDTLFARYANERDPHAGFGDFVIASNIVQKGRPHG